MIENAYYDALRSICQPVRAADFPRSLDPMRALLAELGNPQTRFPSVVVAGSVGKGTTCWRIARALWGSPHPPPPSPSDGEGEKRAIEALLHRWRPEWGRMSPEGRGWVEVRVGLYTGPHLHSFRERFVINGAMISHAEFIEGAKVVTEAASRLDYHYSTFELATALALWWFAQQPVNIAVLEVGMGGRWDAVNAAPNVLAVITPIEKEHIAMLGGSLQTIAWHKAGIMQPGGFAIDIGHTDEINDIFQSEAERLQVHLDIPQSIDLPFDSEPISMALALLACMNLKERAIISTFVHDWMPAPPFPGRLERAQVGQQNVLIDGAHTKESAWRLHAWVRRCAGETEPVRVVIGMLGDKAVNDVLAVFDQPRFHIVLTQAPSHRALSPDALKQQAHLQHASVKIVPELADALAQVHTAPESLFVVTGSLRMAAAAREAFGLLSPDEMEEARATRTIFEGEDYLKRLS